MNARAATAQTMTIQPTSSYQPKRPNVFQRRILTDDNRTETAAQLRLQKIANNSAQTKTIAQLQALADIRTRQDQPIQRGRRNKKGGGKGIPLDQFLAQQAAAGAGAAAPAPGAGAAPAAPNWAAVAAAPVPAAPVVAAPAAAAGPIEINDVAPAEVTNAWIQDRIASMAGFTVESVAYDPPCTAETVNYNVCILGPVTPPGEGQLNRQQDRYTLRLHYHPNPDGANWLHLKRTDAADAGNVIAPGNAILAAHGAALQAGQAAWQADHNGGAPAPQPI